MNNSYYNGSSKTVKIKHIVSCYMTPITYHRTISIEYYLNTADIVSSSTVSSASRRV